MILVVDNRDSFTFNLVQALAGLGAEVEVRRAGDLDAARALALRPDGILVGPGPGPPERAPLSLALFRERTPVPVLGVCLGHQALAVAWGARVERSPVPCHGRAVSVEHAGAGLLADLPTPFLATRYNSLTVVPGSLPAELEATARDEHGDLMALRHRRLPFEGVQFHPESILSEHGLALLGAFLRRTRGDRPAACAPARGRSTDAAARRPPGRGDGV